MKIIVKLRIHAFIYICLTLSTAAILIFAAHRMEFADRNQRIAGEIVRHVFERAGVRADYLLYHEERAKIQWLSKQASITELLLSAAPRFDKPEEKVLFDKLHQVNESVGVLFKDIVSNHEGQKTESKDSTLSKELEARLVSRLLLKAQDGVELAVGLQVLSTNSSELTSKKSLALIIGIVTLLSLTVFYNTIILSRTLSLRIGTLRKGVNIIGAGNLDHLIDIKGEDELSELARAGNEMAAKLKKSYTSVGNLEREVERRKITEEELLKTSAYLDNLIGCANAPIIVWDPEFHITRFNRAFEALTGRNTEDVIGHSFEILFPHDQVETSMELIRRTLGGERWEAVEINILHLNGSVRTVLWNSATLFAPDGIKPVATIAQGQDITQRKQAERLLKESEERFRIAAETANDVVYEWDLKQSVQWLGKIDEMLGYEPGAFPRTLDGWAAVVHPEDLSHTMSEVQAHLDGHAPYAAEYRVRRKDGVYRWWTARGAIARTPDGKPLRWIGSITDITERKRAEERKMNLLADLERSNKELEQFAYVASHDLQEPLRMVSSYTQLLAQKYEGQLDEKAKKYIDYAVDGAVRMQGLINDLLAYSRVNTQGGTLETVDSHLALGEALSNLSAAIQENGALVINDDLPIVQADASQLMLVFQNLIGNAIKFRGANPPRIQVSASDLGNEWRFLVKDNGIGIDAQYTDKVFVIFQRLHTRREYPGTGIGLAICKRIVERHGGRIWFESETGKGSTFYFTLPK